MQEFVKPVFNIKNIFDKPRVMYTQLMKDRLNSELKGIITLMEFYRSNHADVIVHSKQVFSADEILNAYRSAFIELNTSDALCDVRKVRSQVVQLNDRFNPALESVFFTLAILHGVGY